MTLAEPSWAAFGRGLDSLQDIDGPRGNEDNRYERGTRLQHHQRLRSSSERHCVGRAEGRRIRETCVEVVKERW